MSLYSKCCTICENRKYKLEDAPPIPDHPCVKNHDGSSKSMESRGIYDLFVDLWENKKVQIGKVVSDDDCSMRAQMRHSYADLIAAGLMKKEDHPKTAKGHKKADNGKLHVKMKPPTFVADPNHRVKVFGKHVYGLENLAQGKSMVDKAMAQRLKEYFAKMLAQIKLLDPKVDKDKIVNKANAILEHIFDNHLYCGDWCYAKRAAAAKESYTPPPNRPFYCKKKNAKMYGQLKDILNKFNDIETLTESMHPYDTQKCESINNMIARLAPKFKHFGASFTLRTRIALAIGTVNAGYEPFYLELINRLVNLGVDKRSVIHTGIQQIDKKRRENYDRKVSTEFKRQRKFKIKAKIKDQIYEDRISIKMNYGTYSSGINFDDDIEDTDAQPTNRPRRGTTGIKKPFL